MFLKKSMILVLALSLALGAIGCSGAKIDKALGYITAVSEQRTLLQPIYDAVVVSYPQYADQIEAFDAEFMKGIQSAIGALIIARKGDGSISDYYVKISEIEAILDRYKVEEKIPELAKGINICRILLGLAKEL